MKLYSSSVSCYQWCRPVDPITHAPFPTTTFSDLRWILPIVWRSLNKRTHSQMGLMRTFSRDAIPINVRYDRWMLSNLQSLECSSFSPARMGPLYENTDWKGRQCLNSVFELVFLHGREGVFVCEPVRLTNSRINYSVSQTSFIEKNGNSPIATFTRGMSR